MGIAGLKPSSSQPITSPLSFTANSSMLFIKRPP
jgi:hypothetical protein